MSKCDASKVTRRLPASSSYVTRLPSHTHTHTTEMSLHVIKNGVVAFLLETAGLVGIAGEHPSM